MKSSPFLFKSFLFLNFALFFSIFWASASSFVGGRTDFRDETIYFAMTTRFYNGDVTNDSYCWDRKDAGDPAWRGDFKGLIEKLDYIKALGFTAVWITPVVENASGYDYHGYHSLNHKKVDARYESNDVTLKTLVDAVHAKGMKLVLDIVLNHTGNFGDETLCPMFRKEGDLSSIDCMKLHPQTKLPATYNTLVGTAQYAARLAQMKNTDGQNHDSNNFYHHFGNFNWDDWTSQLAQIAGDCVDLNTENPLVYNYLVDAYTQFINLGVDGFRIDTGKHINRLVFNKVFNDAFHDAAKKAGTNHFFMFSEIATRVREIWNRGIPAISTPFYTWKDAKSYAWNNDPTLYQNKVIGGTYPTIGTNDEACMQNYNDNASTSNQPSSTNAILNGNDYHAPDYSMHSGLNVIDFPMHWNFRSADEAFGVAKGGDWAYNDATWNVTYVDSHDYAPDGAPENQRFAQPQNVWAENLSLLFTFRGIPCLYYGSEIEFKKGSVIDLGPNIELNKTGRAYFGGYITGSINTTDFAQYTNATGNMAVTLKHPLALHIQRLNLLRMAIPALRKGQYSTNGCSGSFAFKRRFTDATTDSYALVSISGGATFTNILNGTYTDAVTGDVKTVTSNTLTVSNSGKGNLRVYVLSTTKTPAPGKIGSDGAYIYGTSSVNTPPGNYDGKQEMLEATKPELSISPIAGKYPDPFEVTLTANTTNLPVLIKYTTDGTTPSATNGNTYTTPFTVSSDLTVKAICFDSNNLASTVVSSSYSMGLDVPVVIFGPPSRTFINGTENAISIQVQPSEPNTKIYFTTDGSVPNAQSALYSTAFNINGTNETKIIKAIAIDKLNQTSAVAIGTYLFAPQPTALIVHIKVTGYNQAPYIYSWNENPTTKYSGDWPGTKITGSPDVNGFYTYQFPTDILSSNLIFNKGQGQAQTADIKGVNSERYFEWNGVNLSTPIIVSSVQSPKVSETIRIYPLPASDYFTVILPNIEERGAKILKIYNLNGRELYQKDINTNTTKIQGLHLQAGVYLVQIINKNTAKQYSAKLIITNKSGAL